MSYEELRRKRRRQKNNQNAKKSKTGRTGANEPPAMTKTEKQLGQGVNQLHELVLGLEGDVKTLQDSVGGANKRNSLLERKINMVVQQMNEKLAELDEGMKEFSDEINLLSDSHLELVDVLINQGVIIKEDLTPEDIDEQIDEVEEDDNNEEKKETIDVPELEEMDKGEVAR